MNPESSDAYYNRGAAYQYAGDKKACDDWRKAQSLGNKRAGEMLNKYCK
jgi:Tfp pilus assembly protein PilF